MIAAEATIGLKASVQKVVSNTEGAFTLDSEVRSIIPNFDIAILSYLLLTNKLSLFAKISQNFEITAAVNKFLDRGGIKFFSTELYFGVETKLF